MKIIKRNVNYNDVEFLWVYNFYDMPLDGLCLVDKKICVFEGDYDTGDYTTFSLTVKEKVKWLIRKKSFEICVGYHCTYPQRKNGVQYGTRKPKWFWSMLENIYWRCKK